MRRRQLPKAQRRVLNQVARANNAGAIWWKYTYRHDYKIMRKMDRRGYITRVVREHKRNWVILDLLTPKG
jgi:demethoxyubiquinone hydroxylase (CLK1/Coq7/Cat5 family)